MFVRHSCRCVFQVFCISVCSRGVAGKGGRERERERGREREAWLVVTEQEKEAGSGGALRGGQNDRKVALFVHGRSSKGGGPTRAGGRRKGGRSSERSSGLEKVGVSGCHGYKHTGRDTEKTGRDQVGWVVSQVSAAH